MKSASSTRILLLCLSLAAITTLAGCAAAAESASTPTVQPPADNGRDVAPGGGGSAPGGGGQVDPDQPIGAPPIANEPPLDPTLPDGALPVEPEPGIVNPIPHAWDRITVGPDGQTITIYYWGGVEDCYGLASVDATFDEDGVLHVTVLEGQRGNLAPNTACIEIALLKSVTVTLDRPIVAPAQ